jgi:hypothetical protein
VNVQVIVFCLAVTAVGYGLTYLLDVRLRPEERLSFGVTIGTVVVSTVAFFFAWAYELRGLTVALATVACLMGAWLPHRDRIPDLADDWLDFGRRLRSPLRSPDNPALWVGLTALSTLVSARILTRAYVPSSSGGIAAGSLSTFGDWAAHLAYAGSFAHGDNFPPRQPTAAGADFVYHFGIDFFSALFVPLGVDLFAALTISTGFLAIALPGALYCASVRLVHSRPAAAIGVVFFLTSGGTLAGWQGLYEDLGDYGPEVIFNLPRPYAFDGFHKVWVDNMISGFLYPQRPSLIGFPLTMMVLALLAPLLLGQPREAPSTRGMVLLGVLVGLLPYWHVFALPVLVGLIVVWWLIDRTSTRWLTLLVPAAVIAFPLFLLVRPPDDGRDFRLWWVRGIDESWWGDADVLNIAGFWLYQTGIFIPLLAWVLISRRQGLPGKLALGLAPIAVLLVLPEIAFWHHHPLNNAKYIAFLFLIGSPFVAALLWRGMRSHGLPLVGAVLVLIISGLTGVLDIWRMADHTAAPYDDGRGWPYPADILSASDLLMGEWVRENTDPHAVFASVDANQPAITTVGNRRVVVESTGRLSDLGLDWVQRWGDAKIILDQGAGYEGLIERYGVDYVLVGPNELADATAREMPNPAQRWAATATLVYDFGGQKIFAVGSGGAEPVPGADG